MNAISPLTICYSKIPANQAAIDALALARDLAEACSILNEHYRRGEPLVSDEVYDHVFLAALAQETPDHPFLHQVEPDATLPNMPLHRHASPLLSTAKAYTGDDVARYVRQVEKAAAEISVSPTQLTFRLTPKLDGVSATDNGSVIATRGDGLQGQNITSIFDRGVFIQGGRGLGRGEIVVCKTFFSDELGKGSDFDMEHVRNFVSGFLGADTVKPHHQHALDAKAIRFIPFATLEPVIVSASELMESWERLYDKVIADMPYLTDGVVVEVNDSRLREAMGATSRHERAVVAIKRAGERVATTVEDVRLTTGRTGRITPTLQVTPVYIDGATLSNATAHTVASLAAKGLGKGAEIWLERAGSVIPKVCGVIAPAPEPLAVTHCPDCGSDVVQDGEYTLCPNTGDCPSQSEARLQHWFHTLGNADGFGPKTVAKLVDGGITDITAVYALGAADFEALGFGPGQSANLVRELARSRTESVMEWRWLAAFGIRHLGRGDAKKLLAEIPLAQIVDVSADQLMAIKGFGPKTAPAIAESLNTLRSTIEHMLSLGFTLEADGANQAPADGETLPLAGQRIVFTGTMVHGSRKDMEAQAAALGADVQSAVNTKTTMLVAGEKAGSKREKADAINAKGNGRVIEVLSEADYLNKLEKHAHAA